MSYDPINCNHCGRPFDPSEKKEFRYPGMPVKVMCPECAADWPDADLTRAERRERKPQRSRRIPKRKRLKH